MRGDIKQQEKRKKREGWVRPKKSKKGGDAGIAKERRRPTKTKKQQNHEKSFYGRYGES
jgi:hypothetical protein